MSPNIMALYRFGPYCLAPEERRLWRGDDAVHLTPKAFDLLVLLVRSPGHLVCREELINRLWGDTVVEEHGLTWNVSALRRALGDGGDSPTYIETVRGHGYRFVAPVRIQAEPADAKPAPSPMPVAAPSSTASRGAARRRLPAWRWLALPTAVLVIASLALLAMHRHAPAAAGRVAHAVHRPTLAIVGFRNLSRNHDYDWIGDALTEMLGTELAAGDTTTLIPPSDVMRARRNLQLGADASPPTSEQLKLLRRALGADASITGAYLRQGGNQAQHLRVDVRLRVQDAGGREQDVSFTATGDDLFALVAQLGERLRGRLGMTRLSSAQQGEFMASMPSTTDAAADYASGLSALASGQTLLARTLLQKVTRKEPDFPLAHSALARAWLDLGDNRNAAREARLALRHSAGLSYAQRLLLLGLRAEAGHDWTQAIDAYRKRFDTNPESLNIGLMLARAEDKAGRYADARATLDQLARLPPPFGNDPRVMLASANLHADMGEYAAYYNDAMRAAARADALGQDAMQAHAISDAAHARIRQNKYDQALVLAERARAMFAASDGDSLDAGINLQRIGIAYTSLGQFDRAIAALDDANEMFAQIGNRYWQAASLNNMASIYFHRDRLALARQRYEQALALFRDLHRDAAVAVVLNNLSSVVGGQGHIDQAVAYEKQSLAIHRKLGAPRSVATTLFNLGMQSYALGRLDAADDYLRQARDMYLGQHAPSDASDAISGLADLALTRNRLDEARKGFLKALDMRRRAHVPTSVAWSERDLAELDLDTGRPLNALRRIQLALPVFEKAGARSDAIATRADLALALAQLGRLDEARAQASRLDELIPTVSDLGARLGLEIARARLAHRLHDDARAEQLVADAMQQSARMKIKTRSYPARFEALRLKAGHGLDAAARTQAASLIRDARRDGFARIAAQTRALLHPTPHPA